MAVDDIIGMQIHGRYQMQNIVNTMHFRITEQVSDEHDILQDLATAWVADILIPWTTRHIDTYSMMGVKGFGVTGDNKRPGIVHIDDPGLVVGEESPSPLCRTITLYTDSSNHRRRGRLMLSGCADAMFNDADGAVTASELGLLEQLATYMTADIDLAGNAAEPGLAPAGVLPFERFTGVMARKTPALIRSRRVRGFSIG